MGRYFYTILALLCKVVYNVAIKTIDGVFNGTFSNGYRKPAKHVL